MSDELPEGWARARIGDVFDCWGGMTPSTSEAKFWGGSMPWISSKDVKEPVVAGGTECVTDYALAENRLRTCPAGTVLVVVRSGVLVHTLPVAVTNREVVVNQDVKALDSGDRQLNAWAALYLRATQREILEANRKEGTTVQSIRVPELLDHELAVAPLAEQRRIVAKVEALLEQVRRAKDRLDRVPLILKRFRQAVLAAACAGELSKGWRDAAGRIGRRDGLETWRHMKVHEVAARDPRAIQSGPFGSNLLHSEFHDHGRLVIGIDNVGDGAFLLGRQHRISDDKFRELARYQARPLDVLITVMATIGRCCVVPEDIEPAIITKHVYRISCNQDLVLPYFLLCALRGSPELRADMQEQIRGQTRPGINGSILKELVVPVPLLDEQAEIVRRVEDLFTLAAAIEQRVERAATRASNLPQAILSKAFAGELVPTEAEFARAEGRDYEAAELLLERVRLDQSMRVKPRARVRAPR